MHGTRFAAGSECVGVVPPSSVSSVDLVSEETCRAIRINSITIGSGCWCNDYVAIGGARKDWVNGSRNTCAAVHVPFQRSNCSLQAVPPRRATRLRKHFLLLPGCASKRK